MLKHAWCIIMIVDQSFGKNNDIVVAQVSLGLVKNRPLCSVIGNHVTCVAWRILCDERNAHKSNEIAKPSNEILLFLYFR